MNKREEQRVIEALQALTGGLTVTEPDILMAHNRLKDNLEPPSPRRRLAAVAIVAAAAVLAGFVIFQATDDDNDNSAPPIVTETPTAADELVETLEANAYNARDFGAGAPPTAEELSGVWLLRVPYQAPLLVNGNLEWSHYSIMHERAVGTSTLDGDTWTRTPNSEMCDIGSLPWTASLAGDGSLHMAFAGSENVCTPADSREVWDRLAPGPSPVLDYLRETSADIDWAAPTEANLSGMFVNTETGHLLQVAENGDYWYVESVTGEEFAPSDEGRLDFGNRGTLTGSCEGGSFSATVEVGLTPEVTDYVLQYPAMRIAANDDTCSSGARADGVWVNIWGG